MSHTTREAWLAEGVDLIKQYCYDPLELLLPKVMRISCGLCGGKAIGLCVKPECAEDMATHMFIDPQLDDPVDVLGTIVHEMAHAHCFATGHEDCGHKEPFKRIVRVLGLVGRPTSTSVEDGSELHATLQQISLKLGPYPHAPLRRIKKERPKHSWITFVAVGHEEEYMIRANKNTVKEFGPPVDPFGEVMVPKNPEDMEDTDEDKEKENDA